MQSYNIALKVNPKMPIFDSEFAFSYEENQKWVTGQGVSC
jgi:hypothetical protein